jgi:hypothetical protein
MKKRKKKKEKAKRSQPESRKGVSRWHLRVLWSNAFGLDNLLSCSLVPYVNGVSTSCLGVLLGLVLVVVFFCILVCIWCGREHTAILNFYGDLACASHDWVQQTDSQDCFCNRVNYGVIMFSYLNYYPDCVDWLHTVWLY